MDNIEEVVNVINSIVDSKTIYVFGSYARGEQTADSDIDIYIVAKNINGRVIEKLSEIRAALINVIDKPADILLSTEIIFEERKNYKSSIERIVEKEGVIVYA